MKTKFLKIPSVLLICSFTVSATTPFANAALMDRPPNLVASCDPYLEEGSTLPAACRDATLNGACTGTKTLHDAVVGSVAGSIAYGATAIACGIACFYPAAQMFCTGASALSCPKPYMSMSTRSDKHPFSSIFEESRVNPRT